MAAGFSVSGHGSGWFMDVTLCVLLWAHEGHEDAARDYEDLVLRLIPDHGGPGDRRCRHRAALLGLRRT